MLKFDTNSFSLRFIQYKPKFCNSNNLKDSSLLLVCVIPGIQVESQLCATNDSIVAPKATHFDGILIGSSYLMWTS